MGKKTTAIINSLTTDIELLVELVDEYNRLLAEARDDLSVQLDLWELSYNHPDKKEALNAKIEIYEKRLTSNSSLRKAVTPGIKTKAALIQADLKKFNDFLLQKVLTPSIGKGKKSVQGALDWIREADKRVDSLVKGLP
jgi:hypothetical protein